MFNVCGMEKVKGNFLDFGFPEYKFKGSNNLPLATEIVDQSEAEGIAALLYNNEAQYYLDHGVMVPLYFITKYMKKSFKVLPIGYTYGSRAEHYMFGQLLAEVCEKNEGRIAIIASGDLSHHLNDVDESIRNTGFDFDKMIVKMVNSNDEHGIMEMETTTIAAAGECGYKSIITLLGAVSDQATDPEVYSYEGPFGVGYMVANMNVDKKMQI
jgi:AmmeMemoRadiSam system protein B